jgi:hypothetical protein
LHRADPAQVKASKNTLAIFVQEFNAVDVLNWFWMGAEACDVTRLKL